MDKREKEKKYILFRISEIQRILHEIEGIINKGIIPEKTIILEIESSLVGLKLDLQSELTPTPPSDIVLIKDSKSKKSGILTTPTTGQISGSFKDFIKSTKSLFTRLESQEPVNSTVFFHECIIKNKKNKTKKSRIEP